MTMLDRTWALDRSPEDTTSPEVAPLRTGAFEVETHPSDDQLMEQAQAGSKQAFAALVARHGRAVRGLCRVMLNDGQSVEDDVQDVFLKLWSSRQRYRAEGRFKAYLMVSTRRHCLDQRRRRSAHQRRLQRTMPDRQVLPASHVSAPVDRAQEAAQVHRALGALPERFRVPLVLRYWEDFSYHDIAYVLDIRESTARARVFHGLRKLRPLIEGAR